MNWDLPAFLGGSEVNPLEIRNIPADFARQIFAVPWATTKVNFAAA